MKILALHCDYINFKPLKKALKSVELKKGEEAEKKISEPLVILTAVEKGDSDKQVPQLVKEIKDIAKQVKAENIVLYPYAHLSSNLAKPEIAQNILDKTQEKLKKDFKIVEKAPFGYYKEFELKVKGHPLSELSREIKGEELEKGGEEKYDAKQLLREVSKSKLDTRKLKDNDHRILGQKMDLFSFSETAPGMVFWHNNGLVIRNELIKFWREEHKNAGYEEIKTPQILDKKLWQISGHWEKFREHMFMTDYENREFAIKPMNCPGGMFVYKSSPKSYRDFPLKVGELGEVHRQELSGVLGGLFRVIQFTQDDAHIFCTEDQVERELINVIELIAKFYKLFGFEYRVELSTRPKKRIGSDKQWDKAEAVLEKVLKKKKIKFKLNKGDGAFYGPKIDFHIKDSLAREWQCGTLQLDFAMPERFDLNYTDNKDKKQRPTILHRTIYGSLERFLGILLEHYNGALPTWLSSIQVRVINFTDRNNKYAEKVIAEIKKQLPEIRIDFDFDSTPLGGKIRQAEIEKIPYILVVGDKEQKAKTIAIRKRSSKKIEQSSITKFIKEIEDEIKHRK